MMRTLGLLPLLKQQALQRWADHAALFGHVATTDEVVHMGWVRLTPHERRRLARSKRRPGKRVHGWVALVVVRARGHVDRVEMQIGMSPVADA